MTTINHKYGSFDISQFNKYKERMKKKIFWLIIYTDSKTNEQYQDVDVVAYHKHIMKQISGLNSLLLQSSKIVDILCALETALSILEKEEFDFQSYRKLVLDAGAMMDRLKAGD